MAHKVLLVSAFLLMGLVSEGGTLAGVYHGTVVDADTGEPLSDAAVVVVWYKKARVALPAGDAPLELHAVKETLTDNAGRFAVSAWRGIVWNPLTSVKVPQFVVYKPGYEPFAPGFASRRGFASFEEIETEFRQGATIRLARLAQPECKQRGAVPGLSELGIILDPPSATIANLLRLIDESGKRCGMHTS